MSRAGQDEWWEGRKSGGEVVRERGEGHSYIGLGRKGSWDRINRERGEAGIAC